MGGNTFLSMNEVWVVLHIQCRTTLYKCTFFLQECLKEKTTCLSCSWPKAAGQFSIVYPSLLPGVQHSFNFQHIYLTANCTDLTAEILQNMPIMPLLLCTPLQVVWGTLNGQVLTTVLVVIVKLTYHSKLFHPSYKLLQH